tara:strand:+ start:1003 stop:2163 length:1161 start_codon:yes stop_codon:yes gene_type:complete
MRKITNIKVPEADKSEDENNLFSLVLDENGIILSMDKTFKRESSFDEDWSGDWISPRAIDLQINGGLGISFTDLTFSQIPKVLSLLDRLWLDGVEGICPTFVSCSQAQFQLGMKVLKETKKHISINQCRLLGAHMEGPFLCKSYSGAHDIDDICEPSINALNERIKGFEDDIALMTLAPELKGAFDVIARLRKLNIVASLGHSSADFDAAMKAFDSGVSMITHTFNAMKGLHHRAIGPIGAAARREDVFLGLIGDGVHVQSDMIKLLNTLAPNKIVLVSDAISAYGLGDGSFIWDNRLIKVKDGLCRLQNETIAGSTLPLLDACKKIAKWIDDPSAAIWMATLAPRMVLSQNQIPSQSFFIGKNIDSLLRWKMNSRNQQLSWHVAA